MRHHALLTAALMLAGVNISVAQETIYQPSSGFESALQSTVPPVAEFPNEPAVEQASGSFTASPDLGVADVPLMEADIAGPMISLDNPDAEVADVFQGITRDDFRFIFPSDVKDRNGNNGGSLQIFELDLGYDIDSNNPTVLAPLDQTTLPFFSYREWTGPGTPELPPNVFRFAFPVAFGAAADKDGGFGFSVTPQFAADMRANMNSDAWMFDIDLYNIMRISEDLHLVYGAFYWDRVDAIVLPHAGFTWTPGPDFYLHMVYPHPEIGACLYESEYTKFWLTMGLAYHVEAYQIKSTVTGGDEMVQMADYRALLGCRLEGEKSTLTFDVGYVFDREMLFRYSDDVFSLESGLMLSGGMTF